MEECDDERNEKQRLITGDPKSKPRRLPDILFYSIRNNRLLSRLHDYCTLPSLSFSVPTWVLCGRDAKMTGVDEILNYQRNPDDDYYVLLGCDENSSVEQITAEYKLLALQYHPDKNDGDKEAEAKFQQLKEAKETLCDPSRRALYDKWKKSGIAMGYKQWLGMKDHVQQSMHWSKPNTKDRMLEGDKGSGPSSLGPSNAAARRASEGGAALWGRWGTGNQEPPSEVINKFRNYEI